ncbi:hypothetical protein XACM_1630 [Xanthomonas euvesicatoria pv. citrumelo F1]|nr:hypothetical protein XACM_1630 [Xanthomonas euvesicatoria pv. citrumelo F1]
MPEQGMPENLGTPCLLLYNFMYRLRKSLGYDQLVARSIA